MAVELVVESASNGDLAAEAERLGTVIASATGTLLSVLGEFDRREAWRDDGATSLRDWLAERLGVSEATGRCWTRVAATLWDLPHLAEGARSGAISFDKLRAAVDLASPATDADVLRRAQECSVRQLGDLVRDARGISDEAAASRYDSRYLRFNDARCTVSAQLPEDLYAEVRNAIMVRVKQVESDGQTPLDQRSCDALVALCRAATDGDGGGGVGVGSGSGSERSSGSRPRYFVVAHTDLSLLRGGTGTAEIERLGLLSPETMRRIACDAEVALAVDDAFGHTMFEGRSRRFPSPTQRREAWRRDRRCRFPGCGNSTFTNVHHIVLWDGGGLTDLGNLVTLCEHHHHRIHEKSWNVTGNANGTLRFTGPNDRTMISRPSPLWTRRRD